MDIGAITRRDLGYFEYYISKASNNPAIITYTRIYKFELYAVLLDKMDLIPPVLENNAIEFYGRNNCITNVLMLLEKVYAISYLKDNFILFDNALMTNLR